MLQYVVHNLVYYLGNQVVVRSRDDHGSSVLELFDTAMGILRDRVLASEVQKGQPSWAGGFTE